MRNSTIPVVCDVMSDDANIAYGGYFDRMYVIRDGVVEVEGERGPDGYDIDVIQDWLSEYSKWN